MKAQNKRHIVRQKKDESVNAYKMELKAVKKQYLPFYGCA